MRLGMGTIFAPIYKALKEREESSGRKHVSYPPREPQLVAVGERNGASPKG